MGRTVLAPEVIKDYVNELYNKKEVKLGLALGQSRQSEQKDYLIHLVETPLQDDDEDAQDSESNNKKASKPKAKTLEQWNTDLVTQHATQVTRMLVGGFDVLGIFICTIADSISTSELAHIRQVLSAVHKVLSQDHFYTNVDTTERLIVHISCVPNKISCKTLSVTSSLASPKPIDFKYLSQPMKWTRLNCQFAVDFHIPQIKENSQSSLINQFKLAIQPICEQVQRSVATFDGCMRGDDELLEPEVVNVSKGKRGASKHKIDIEENCEQKSINVELYTDSSAAVQSNILQLDCDVDMKFNGTIVGRAYAPEKCSVKDSLTLLKFDLLRSLASRCDIHCVDLLVIEEEQQDRVVVHELPRRIFAPLAGLDLTVSDYLFPGETACNSLDAFKELLNLDPNSDDIEDDCERFPDSNDLASSTLEQDDRGVPVEEMLPVKPPKSCNYICIGTSIFVGILSVGISLYFVSS